MTHLPHSERPGAPPGNEPDVRSAGTPAVRERWDVADLHRLLVEQVQDYAIFVLDPEGRILSWNRGAERLKGYAAEEIIGRHFSVFYPPEDRAANVTGWELEVAAKEGRFEDEGWRVRKDGSRFWANVVITALRGPEGKLVGFGKVTRDLTERHAANVAFRQSEERFRLLVQSVQDYGIFMLAPSGRVMSWNEGAQRINGYKAEEIIGRHFSAFYPAEDKAANKPGWELEIAAREGRFEDEGWRVRKDGSRFWANVVITALRSSEGMLLGFAKVTRDLTERNAAQERSIENARRLAVEETARRMAEERAEALSGLLEQVRSQAVELERRRQEADAANRIKGDFLAAMSHELRTPLNAIDGYAELLELGIHGPITGSQREALERIRRSQRHLLGIINDLLTFSRAEAGRLTYEIAPLEVPTLVDAVLLMVTPQAEARSIGLEREVGPALALGDATKVEQILLNLLSNAVKFTAPGGRIRVDGGVEGEWVKLRVRDTGIGIPDEKRDLIFEPFVQVGRTLSRQVEGTGLGLAISRELARAMGGELRLGESEEGVGSTFVLELPRA